MKRKSLEFYFNGIIGHLRDRWGYALDYNTLCSQLANYWRSWFGAPTIGPDFEPYAESQLWEEAEHSPAPVPVAAPATDPDPQIPVQILQVAWFLQALINENPDMNAQLIHELQKGHVGQVGDLHQDRADPAALATLCAELSILANMLAQQYAANQEIEELPQEDDGI